MAHYYKADGSSCHKVVAKNGNLRDTTIADARKLALFPSVSTVKEVGVGYNLVAWMLNLLLDTVVETPFNQYDYESIEEYKKQALRLYNNKREGPQRRGTEIHDKLEQYYSKGVICPKDEQYIVPVIKEIEDKFPGVKWVSEKSFACAEFGFGGCVDLHSEEGIVLDFKTKDKEKLDKTMQYDDHKMQLAAYQVGLALPEDTKRYNLFCSTNVNTPGKSLLIEAKEFDKPWEMFYTLLKYWQIKNNYVPGGCND